MTRGTRKIVDLPSLGTRKTFGHVSRVNGCGFEEIEMPIHEVTADHERFRETRRASGLNIRDTALKLGIRASQVSGLEFGRCAPEDGDWDALIRELG